MDAVCPAHFVLHVTRLPHVRFAPGALNSSALWADILTSQLFSANLILVFSLIIFLKNFQEKNDFFFKFCHRQVPHLFLLLQGLCSSVTSVTSHTQDSRKHTHKNLPACRQIAPRTLRQAAVWNDDDCVSLLIVVTSLLWNLSLSSLYFYFLPSSMPVDEEKK